MALQGFDKDYYLGVKAAAVGLEPAALETALDAAGFTPEAHYMQFGWTEGLAPNAFFNADEYILAKANQLVTAGDVADQAAGVAAFNAAWTVDPYQHYLQFGPAEGIDPSNSFDESAYLQAKLEDLQANDETAADWTGKTAGDLADAFADLGITALGHFIDFGEAEGLDAVAVPADEQVSVDFTLTEGLADVAAADAAVTTYIEANTIDTDDPEDGIGDGDAAEITGALTTAADLLDTAIEATSVVASNYATDSDVLRAALLSDANADLAAQLAAAETTLAAKQEAVTAKVGLTEAVAAYEVAQDFTVDQTAAEETADLAFKTADATYDINAAVTAVAGGGVDTLITGYGALIDVNGTSGLLQLATGVTEVTNPGITAVLTAALAHNAAVVAQDAAVDAEAAALIEVGVLDTVDNNATLLTTVVGLMGETSATYAEIQAFATDLQAGVATLKAAIESVSTTGDDAGDTAALAAVTTLAGNAVTAGYIDATTETAIIGAFGTLSSDGAGADAGTTGATDTEVLIAAAITAATDELVADNLSKDFDVAVKAYTDDAAGNITATEELVAAQEAIFDDNDPEDADDDSGIQFDIDELAELNADAVAAEAVADGLVSLQDAAADAAAVIIEEGFQAPVTLTADVAATSGDDVYIAGSDNVSIANFDLLGSDTLFIGSDFVANSGDITTDGDDSVLEMFLTAANAGADTVVSLETSVFGSNATTPEVVEITLTGVALADVTLADGLITVA